MPLRARHLVHFTAALYVGRGILYYTSVLLFALSPRLCSLCCSFFLFPSSLPFLFLLPFPIVFSIPLAAIRSSPTLDCMHIRSTSPNRIMVISLSYRASSRLSNVVMYAHPQRHFATPYSALVRSSALEKSSALRLRPRQLQKW